MTANLRTPRITVKQAAKIMNVSERSIYMARTVARMRPDLDSEVMAGRMSLSKAHRIALGKAKPTSWDRLLRAWNSASDDDRDRLAFIVLKEKTDRKS